MSKPIPELPSEIISDILSRLPVKCLVRFKCVSKPWHSLISNPKFTKIHLKRSKQDNNVNHHRILLFTSPFLSVDPEAYTDGDENLVTTQLSNIPGRNLESEFEIVGSCNGLVCAVFDSENHIVVWNPTTRDSKELPVPNSLPNGKFFSGFGYDHQLDDYKIVRGSISTSTNNNSNYRAKVEVLTLKSNMWRTIQDLEYSIVFEGAGTYADGVLYWLAQKESEPNKKLVTVSFDLAEEKFLETVRVLDIIDHACLSTNLKVLRDCLCLYTSYYGSIYASYFQAWIMKEHGPEASWTLLSRFSSDELPGCKYWLDLVYVTMNGKVLMNLDGWDIVLYNPREDAFKRFTIQHDWDWFKTTTFIESLVSPNV